MGTEALAYIPYVEAVLVHIELMRFLGETHYGVFSRELVASALTRPQQAAAYDNSDLIQQAATLLYGLIKNHPWVGGNKTDGHSVNSTFPQAKRAKDCRSSRRYTRTCNRCRR